MKMVASAVYQQQQNHKHKGLSGISQPVVGDLRLGHVQMSVVTTVFRRGERQLLAACWKEIGF